MSFHLQIPRRTVGLIIVLLFLLAIGGLAFVYLPKATIIIEPSVSSREIERDITLSTAASEPDFIKYVLPAKLVEKEIREERDHTREAQDVREDFAKGRVTLHNNQDEDQPLLPKTHLRHEETGVFFLTDGAVNIPAHGETGIGVTAKEQGKVGDVPSGRFVVDKLPESLQSEVYAESTQAFTGGVAGGSPITQEEIDAAKQDAVNAATERALGELTLEAGGAKLNPNLINTEVVSEEASVEPGSEAVSYSVAATVRVRGFAVDENDLLSLTLLALKSSVSENEEFVSYTPESFQVEIGRADFERGDIRVKTKIAGNFGTKIGASVLELHNIAGLSAKETKEHFEEFDSGGAAEVTFWPFWVSSIPSRTGAIEIVVSKSSDQ